ncbi:hypothetical protein [Dubosiella newyorkensis]|jgi:flagellar basal body-associated protein FliL|uniref:Uncharacterized protein n=1 Tax=Dubosiella newyorkensis TaxID=1862672 RepID=A0A1U7NMT7_9FIRM|nr:hypothetical protein [Dubosiella newyorkensis]EOS60930.1 hypothetical protein C815_00938 [Firmicutes bacterium M10-2]OLU46606.1 hypothetical protein BO225_05395 [Dubosiella newyorkensis]
MTELEQEKERREAFMKTYGVSEEEMDFFEYIDGRFELLKIIIAALIVLLVLAVLAAIAL